MSNLKISTTIQIPNSLLDGSPSNMPVDFSDEDLAQNMVRFCIGNDPNEVYCIDLDRMGIVYYAMIAERNKMLDNKEK